MLFVIGSPTKKEIHETTKGDDSSFCGDVWQHVSRNNRPPFYHDVRSNQSQMSNRKQGQTHIRIFQGSVTISCIAFLSFK
jgi:hypothetical protein